jgi:hypothetical protein
MRKMDNMSFVYGERVLVYQAHAGDGLLLLYTRLGLLSVVSTNNL